MALKDLIRPEPTPAAERPAGISCDKYVRAEGKRCLHYLPNGSCSLPTEFMCVEWLKRNPAPQALEPAPAPSTSEPSRDLFGEAALPVVQAPKRRTAPPMRAPSAPAPSEPTVELTQLRGFTTEDIESFKALGVEVQLESESYGELWLVPEYTHQPRKELTPEHAATLLGVLSVFPGSRVVAFQKSTTTERPERPEKRS